MQPGSFIKLDEKSFDVLKRTIKNISIASRGKKYSNTFATKLPMMVGMKITNQCNLRCKHCYEWSKHGFHRNMEQTKQDTELDFDIVEKVMNETSEMSSSLYVWGGEPLIYNHFDEFANLLEQDPRILAICTNGLNIEKKMDSILKMGTNLELVIALDGLEMENDSIRGAGTYQKVMNAINTLQNLREKNLFSGKITIHAVINNEMIGKLYDFVEHLESKAVDSLILCFPWYISPESAGVMDRYFTEKFQWLNSYSEQKKYSWHSFKYGINPELTEVLQDEISRITMKVWSINVRFFPSLKQNELREFIQGKHVLAQNRTKCNALSTRMDILPDGSVSSCKHFPEFTIGNLKNMSLYEVWNSEQYNKIREIIDNELMTICSQCNVLYLHGT